MRRLILKTFQSPGDVLMLSAAIRDLHAAHPGKFQTDVRTSCPAIWMHNPHLTPLAEGDVGVEQIDMHYPLIHHSNQRPYHFLHGYVQYLEQQLGLDIPVTRFAADIHLSPAEKQAASQVARLGHQGPYWIVVAGGKYDFTAKWWNPASYQAVKDHFQGKLQFVQCGEEGHWHPKLTGVIDLVGNTSPREFIQLMYQAQGVLCGVTYAMHLAAAVETPPGQPPRRACVVVAGGREPPHWEAYPGHHFHSTVGLLDCCAAGGCWRSRCQLVGDGDSKDRDNLCSRPVPLTAELRIPRCLDLIPPQDIIRSIEMHFAHDTLLGSNRLLQAPESTVAPQTQAPSAAIATKFKSVLLEFRHGLGDAIQLTSVLTHLRHYHPEWEIDVAVLTGKESAFRGLCRRAYILDQQPFDRSDYDMTADLKWPECPFAFQDSPSTKAEHCLRSVFQLSPREEFCRYVIHPSPVASESARRYLQSISRSKCEPGQRYPVVLLHYQGNTSTEQKNLSHELASAVCEEVLAAGYVPVILDWDRRTPLADGVRIHNPGTNVGLWGGCGTGDAAALAALIQNSALMIGVDSGPLHVAGATTTPTVAVWTAHHPLHYFGLADNVLHLVPQNHEALVRGDAQNALDFFLSRYRHQVYAELKQALCHQVRLQLAQESPSLPPVADRSALSPAQLRSKAYSEQYYREHVEAGLDYLVYGDWQCDYGRWLVESFDLSGLPVLDVGCACGSIAHGLAQAGAQTTGIDLTEHMIRLGREKFTDVRLEVCDSANLHLFQDGQFALIHSAQSAEHFQPDLVPNILKELLRVSRPGAYFFCALDTEELYTRQGRDGLREDPTHVCVKPLAWWHHQLELAGWELCEPSLTERLREHPLSYLPRYDWDLFVARKPLTSRIRLNGAAAETQPGGQPS